MAIGVGKARALTIAGSDSGGGAGIQADLKTFAALGVYGTSAITAVTAQNTVAVTGVHEIPTETVMAQIEAVLTDIGADAVKTGMLSSAEIIICVAGTLRKFGVEKLVVDPVMVSKSGGRLLKESAVDALKHELLPLASVVTPNIPEAETLAGMEIKNTADVEKAARLILKLGPRTVIIKGGHLPGDPVDRMFSAKGIKEFFSPRIDTRNTHGTGCTFAAAIAAGIARGEELEVAVQKAKEFVTEALMASLPIGKGHGPLNHFYRFSQG